MDSLGTSIGETKKNSPSVPNVSVNVFVAAIMESLVDVRPNVAVEIGGPNDLETVGLVDGDDILVVVAFHRSLARPTGLADVGIDIVRIRINLRIPVPVAIVFVAAAVVVVVVE